MSRSDFWSRRKAAVEAEERAKEAAEEELLRAEQEAELAERSDEDILEELGLPNPDEIQDSEQVRAFLTDAVPSRLKTRALRRLWTLNPLFGNLDGLVDYGEDFTDAAMVVENMQTAYQVGKGMLTHVLDLEEKARQAEASQADGPDLDAADLEQVEQEASETLEDQIALTDQTSFEPEASVQPPAPEAPVFTAEAAEQSPSPARRMRFHFDTPEAPHDPI